MYIHLLALREKKEERISVVPPSEVQPLLLLALPEELLVNIVDRLDIKSVGYFTSSITFSAGYNLVVVVSYSGIAEVYGDGGPDGNWIKKVTIFPDPGDRIVSAVISSDARFVMTVGEKNRRPRKSGVYVWLIVHPSKVKNLM